MKRILGIILLLLSLLMVTIGMYGITYYSARKNFYYERYKNDFNVMHDLNNDIGIGFLFFLIGIVLFIVGLLLTIAKTNKHKALELDLKIYKSREISKY